MLRRLTETDDGNDFLREGPGVMRRKITAAGLAAGLFIGGGTVAAAQDSPDFPCLNPPTLDSTVPSDSPITDQNSLNCFAWQEFIALNWKADGIDAPAGPDPVANFGAPDDTGPTVWETYSDIHSVFLPDGSPPPPFGELPPAPAACAETYTPGTRVLTRSSKVSVDFEAPDDIAEAFPFDGSPNWLADRDGNQVWYEIMINRDEFDYIVANRLYNAVEGYLATLGGQKVDLPRGRTGGAVGAIELKSAWVEVPDPAQPVWSTYKLTEALIHDPAHGSCETATLALVGLHIIHKTESQPQWIWSTFEHVANAPDAAAVSAGDVGNEFRFFNPSCAPQAIPAQCVGNSVARPDGTLFCDAAKVGSPTETSCTPNASPGFCVTPDCPPMPVQVAREHAIADGQDNLVASLNAAAQSMIRAAAPDSVFANYMLVDVLWSDSPVDENTPNRGPSTAPLSISGMRPAPTERPVANTTMETYIQGTTCISCHMGAKLAWPSQNDALTPFASDYSFSFQNARPIPAGE